MSLYARLLPLLLVVFNAQRPFVLTPAVTDETLSKLKVVHFKVVDQDMIGSVATLSWQQDLHLHLGLEEVLKEKTADPDPINPRFSLTMDNNSVSEVMDKLCEMDNRYTWKFDGTTINIYPRLTSESDSYLFNRRFGQLRLTGLRDPYQALFPMIAQLPPPREQIAYAQAGGNPSYAQPWDLSLSDVTVREAIDALAAKIGPNSSWILQGSTQYRQVTFTKGPFYPVSVLAPERKE